GVRAGRGRPRWWRRSHGPAGPLLAPEGAQGRGPGGCAGRRLPPSSRTESEANNAAAPTAPAVVGECFSIVPGTASQSFALDRRRRSSPSRTTRRSIGSCRSPDSLPSGSRATLTPAGPSSMVVIRCRFALERFWGEAPGAVAGAAGKRRTILGGDGIAGTPGALFPRPKASTWVSGSPRPGETFCREEAAVNSDLIARARAGDEDAFRHLVGRHQRELHVHCYRILGSVEDAEDQVQETFLAAWHGIAGFEARASVRVRARPPAAPRRLGGGGAPPRRAGRAPARASGADLLQRGDLAPAISRRVAGGAPRTGAGPGSAVSGERGDLARLRRRPAA